jgi:hypothetical protein
MKNTYSKTRHTFMEDGKPLKAIVYGGLVHLNDAYGNIIIEDLGENNKHGRYMLTIANDGWMSDNLEDLEPRLFEWMQAEGFEYDEEESPEIIWQKRVSELESLGATTSDAQAVADAEMEKLCSWGWAKE